MVYFFEETCRPTIWTILVTPWWSPVPRVDRLNSSCSGASKRPRPGRSTCPNTATSGGTACLQNGDLDGLSTTVPPVGRRSPGDERSQTWSNPSGETDRRVKGLTKVTRPKPIERTAHGRRTDGSSMNDRTWSCDHFGLQGASLKPPTGKKTGFPVTGAKTQ